MPLQRTVEPPDFPSHKNFETPRPLGTATAADGESEERERLTDRMKRCGWVQAKAARLLRLTPRQMGYALRKHGIEIKHF